MKDFETARDNCQERTRLYSPYNPAKMFSVSYLLTLAKSLPLDDISRILAAEELREQGLSAIRDGAYLRAADLLDQSADVASSPVLSEHALIAARTFQSAAVAYLYYRTHRYDDAIYQLMASIDDSVLLGTRYGHRMEWRKIHLARNLIRTECYYESPDRILHDTAELLRYAAGESDSWQFDSLRITQSNETLADNELTWAFDEIVMNLTIPELWRQARPLYFPLNTQRNVDCHRNDPMAAWAACETIVAAHRHDARSFYESGTRFYELQSGGMVRSADAIDSLEARFG